MKTKDKTDFEGFCPGLETRGSRPVLQYSFLKGIFLLINLLMVHAGRGQVLQEISLDECVRAQEAGWPMGTEPALIRELEALNVENARIGFLPRMQLTGQFSFQSDVVKVDIPVPGVNIPSPSADQYKLAIELSQTLFDGGQVRALSAVHRAGSQASLQKLEVETYALRDRIIQSYFGVLAARASKAILEKSIESIEARQKVLEAGVREGALTEQALDRLLAEKATLRQQIEEIVGQKRVSLSLLKRMTGLNIDEETKLVVPVFYEQESQRPELLLFDNQEKLIMAGSELNSTRRMPRIFLFGQMGYGRPGLNMLRDEFDSYYVLGAGLSWNIWDWKQTRRENQMNQIRIREIGLQKDAFLRNRDLALERERENQIKLKNILQSDQELVELRARISSRTLVELEQGSGLESDYLEDLNRETQARLSLELHQILLGLSFAQENFIRGK